MSPPKNYRHQSPAAAAGANHGLCPFVDLLRESKCRLRKTPFLQAPCSRRLAYPSRGRAITECRALRPPRGDRARSPRPRARFGVRHRRARLDSFGARPRCCGVALAGCPGHITAGRGDARKRCLRAGATVEGVEPVRWSSRQGLYDPLNEHDACGVGFVANIKNRKSPPHPHGWHQDSATISPIAARSAPIRWRATAPAF